MATLKAIPTSYLTPARALPQQELADEYITNPEACRLLTYGTRDTRQSDPPHDHGQDGGEVLVGTPVLSLTLGPGLGMQIQRSIVLGTSPRILCTAGLVLRGGISQLSGLLGLSFDAVSQVDLYVSLRPYTEANRNLQVGLQSTALVSFLVPAAPLEMAVAFTLSDLSALGDSRYDREVEVVVWQAYLPSLTVTTGHRLRAVYLDVLAVDTFARDAERSELPRQSISYADIKTGAILGQDLGRKMRDTHNAMLRGMLGRSSGQSADGRADVTRSYRQDLFCGHQHQGIDVPDGCGGYWSDGAVLRDPVALFSLCDSNQVAGITADYAGAVLSSSGVFDATALTLETRASIPSGLGALDLRFELAIATLQQTTRLLIHADVRGLDGVSICTGISSGIHAQESAQDADGLYVCECDPLDSNLFTPSRKRRLARAGLWTLAALRAPTPAQGLRASNHQISEVVRLRLTQPKVDPANTYHPTGDYIIILRFELQTPFGASAVDPLTKLNWGLVLPSRGF